MQADNCVPWAAFKQFLENSESSAGADGSGRTLIGRGALSSEWLEWEGKGVGLTTQRTGKSKQVGWLGGGGRKFKSPHAT